MVFVGNTSNGLETMLRHTNLFEEVPPQFNDGAFIDRLHYYLPGWEVEIIRNEMFSRGYGFVVDYLAEILRQQRDYDYTHHYQGEFSLPTGISTRDRDGINKTFSGMFKLLFPDGNATVEEIRELLVFAIEGRKRVKDQLVRLDNTFDFVKFGYEDARGNFTPVYTAEELQYPQHYYQKAGSKNAALGLEEIPIPDSSSKIDDAQIIRNGETNYVEFKTTLQFNNRTGQSDPKLEKSSLKTIVAFLNSNGGTLYLGVDDDGEILGISEDNFPSDDKFQLHFNNLFNDKIGRQFGKYVNSEILQIDGKSVFKVACSRSDDPVFYLENQRNEEFYVRQGPSSVQLSMSEFKDYIRDRFRK